MNLETERMSVAGQPKPENGKGFGGIFENGFYINYLHGLDFLCRKYVKSDTRILELGCFYGVSTELFCKYSQNITCVDVERYNYIDVLIEKYNINFINSDSIDFLKELKHNSYDLIYIDTTHDYTRTKQEILLSYNILDYGSIISGHDFNTPGVHNAIADTFSYPDIEIYLDSSWSIIKTKELKLKI